METISDILIELESAGVDSSYLTQDDLRRAVDYISKGIDQQQQEPDMWKCFMTNGTISNYAKRLHPEIYKAYTIPLSNIRRLSDDDIRKLADEFGFCGDTVGIDLMGIANAIMDAMLRPKEGE